MRPFRGLEPKAADRAAATAQSAALVPYGKSDCARHLGGCLLARAPDLFRSDEAGACMKPAIFFADGVLFCPLNRCPALSDKLGMPWEFMVINRIFWEF